MTRDANSDMGAGHRLHHIGLAVSDLERSVAFYRDLAGLPVRDCGIESDEIYARMMGVDDLAFSWAELDLGDGQVLELLRYEEPQAPSCPAPADAAEPRAPSAPAPPTGPHIAITVSDVEAVHRALVDADLRVFSEPLRLHEDNHWDGSRVFYARDPDGNLVEFVQGS